MFNIVFLIAILTIISITPKQRYQNFDKTNEKGFYAVYRKSLSIIYITLSIIHFVHDNFYTSYRSRKNKDRYGPVSYLHGSEPI